MGQGLTIGRRGGRGGGMGTGTGMGRVRGMTSREQERKALTQRLEELEDQLKGVRGRLEKLRQGNPLVPK